MRRTPPPVTVRAAPDAVRRRWAALPRVDAAQLRRLHEACADVTTDPAALAAAAVDWWPRALRWARRDQVPAMPDVVVTPQSLDEVCAVVRVCDAERIPVTVAGGRSGVCGGAIPLHGGVALDTLRLAGVTAVDDASLLIDAGCGTFGPDLENTLRRDHGLTLGHWPQSIELSTLGGWLACRAAGQYSTRYGKIEDMVAGLEVVVAGGDIVRTGSLGNAGPRAATGPDLTQLFVGSEGTLGVITSARLRAHPLPPAERRNAWSFDDFDSGLDAVRRTLRRGATPAVVRLYDAEDAKRNFDHDGVLLIALDEGEAALIDASMAVLTSECGEARSLGTAPVDAWLAARNDVSVLGRVLEMGIVVDTIEVAARWSQLPALYSDAVRGLRALPGTVAASAHQSHAYVDGACLYFTFAGIGPDAEDDAWAEQYYDDAWDAVMRATLAHHGSISHHHGVGLQRGPYAADALGAGFEVLRRLKTALDPHGIFNPGKLGLEAVPGA
ncbi:MAG TPA: FAD-binding oxidoreductase [Candidatus Dormibacteraeota bacterium]